MSILDGSPSLGIQTSVQSSKPLADAQNKLVQSSVGFEISEGKDPSAENSQMGGLVHYIEERFQRSKIRRQQDERRWLQAYTNFRGVYDDSTRFTSTEKSQVFIKITKTKVLASYAQIIDVLFAGNKFPIGIKAVNGDESQTPETVHIDAKDPSPPDPIQAVRPEILGTLKKIFKPQVTDKLQTGPGLTPQSATWEPQKLAAKKMEKKIHDQLAESDADMHLRSFAFELCLLGTGVVKGPFAYDKEYPNWGEDGVYNPTTKTIPRSSYVSVWSCYPDAEAKNMSECDYFIERHKMSASRLRDLKKRHGFRPESINMAVMIGPSWTPEYWENTIDDNRDQVSNESYQVLEYWGTIDKQTAEMAELDLPDNMKDDDEIAINAWICNNQILRLILNPFTPRRIPYHACPYELNPYSFFGIGVAENMVDSQKAMNGMMRLIIDNAALSSNVIIEVNETNLVPNQSMEVFPGKIFKTNGVQGQSIWSTKFDNITTETLQVYDKFRQLADESTSMPSYAHGGTGINQVGRTAAGMQMLMGAADKTVKAVIKNIDDYLLRPWGNDHYSFNMQFNFDKDMISDMEVVAMGTDSLMKNDVRAQKLQQFLQIGSANPLIAPFMKVDYLMREIADSYDLDPELVVNDPREALMQAMIMQQLNPQGQGQANPSQPPNGAADGSSAPPPGTPGFSGDANTGNNNNPAGANQQSQPNAQPQPQTA